MIEIIPNWHPLLVHFTIALVSMAALFYLIAKIRQPDDPQAEAATAGRWALIAGALITLATVAAGFYAYNTVNHDDLSHAAMTDHRNWAVPTALVILGLAFWAWRDGRKSHAPSWLFVALLLITSASLAVVGYKGAELVYRHGMGVMRLPQTGGVGHHHGANTAAHTHGQNDHQAMDRSHNSQEDEASPPAHTHDEADDMPHSHEESAATPHTHAEGEEGHAH